MRMGKILRRGEDEPLARRLEEIGIYVLYSLHGGATAEGGDTLVEGNPVMEQRLGCGLQGAHLQWGRYNPQIRE